MKTLYKAQPTGDQVVPDLNLTAAVTLPETDYNDPDMFKKSEARFTAQAEIVVNALESSLPGGTLERVLVVMLQRKAVYWTCTVGAAK